MHLNSDTDFSNHLDSMQPRVKVVMVRPLINRETNAPFFLPLGLLCVAASLQRAGHETEIVDFEFLYRVGEFQLSESFLADACEPLLRKGADIIGITVLA